jgi:uncharacterized protein YfaS (alpha-2-macroglobulin family)
MKKLFVVPFFVAFTLLSGCSWLEENQTISGLTNSTEPNTPTNRSTVDVNLPSEFKTPTDAEGFAKLDDLPELSSETTYAVADFTTLPEPLNRIGERLPIELEFSEEMQQEPTQDAFILEPEVEGEFEWPNPNKMIFRPSRAYVAGTTYTARLTSAALDANGNNLPAELKREFEVTEDLEVLKVLPSDEIVSAESDITIIFNQPIAELGTLDQIDDKDFGVTLEPEFPHRYRLAGTSTLQIQGQMPSRDGSENIENRLPFSSEIEVTIPKEFTALSGETLPADYEFTINTGRLEMLTDSSSSHVQTDPLKPLVIRFNQPVDLEALRENTTVADFDDGQLKDFSIGFGPLASNPNGGIDPTMILITPSDNFWGYLQTIQVNIAEGIRGLEGNIPIEGLQSITYATHPLVNISAYDEDAYENYRYPSYNENRPPTVGATDRLLLRFAMPPVSLEALRNNISGSSDESIFEVEYKTECTQASLDQGYGQEDCEKQPDTRSFILTRNRQATLGTTDGVSIDQALTLQIENEPDQTDAEYRSPLLGQTIQLKNNHLARVNIAEQVSIEGHYAKQDDYREVCLYSNNPLDIVSVEENLEITPEPLGDIRIDTFQVHASINRKKPTDEAEQEIFNCQNGEYHNKYATRIRTEMPFNTDVTFTLGEAATDIYDTSIDEAYTFSHQTGSLLDSDISISALQNEYAIMPAHLRPEITLKTVNVPGDVQVEICRIDQRKLLRQKNIYGREYREQEPWVGSNENCGLFVQHDLRVPQVSWKPQYPVINLKNILGDRFEPGTYVVAASHPRFYFNDLDYTNRTDGQPTELKTPRFVKQIVQVTSLNAILKTDGKNTSIWVSTLENGAPAANATVYAIDVRHTGNATNDLKIDELGTTDSTGVFELSTKDHNRYQYFYFTTENDSLLVARQNVLHHPDGLYDASTRMYAFSDRALYQPGDEVLVKTTAFTDDDAKYQPAASAIITLKSTSHREAIEEQSKTANQNGSAEFAFRLPNDIDTGNVALELCAEGRNCTPLSIEIQEYVKPEFAIEVESEQPDYTNRQTARLPIRANYYFGAPLANAAGELVVTRTPYTFDKYTAEDGFVFGKRQIEPWLLASRDYQRIMPVFESEQVRSEQFRLDENGTFVFEHEIALPNLSNDLLVRNGQQRVLRPIEQSHSYTVEAGVSDQNNNPVAGRTEFIAHSTNQLVGIKTPKQSAEVGEEITLDFVVVNTDGLPIPEPKQLQLLIAKDNPLENRGGIMPAPERLQLVRSETLTTDQTGKARFTFTPEQNQVGRMHFIVQLTDDEGRLYRSYDDMYVFSAREMQITNPNSEAITIIADKTEYTVGETMELYIESPLVPSLSRYMLSLERDSLHDTALIDFRETSVLRLKVTEKMIPNVYVGLAGQQFGPSPQYAQGQRNIKVSAGSKRLPITITPDKQGYAPGEQVELQIQAGEQEAELAVVVVDKAQLALMDGNREHIFEFFYAARDNAIATIASYINALKVWQENENFDESEESAPPMAPEAAMSRGMGMEKSMMMDEGITAVESDMGGAGGGEQSSAPRTEFKDTAYFKAIVQTDKDGSATTSFTLPDNLTTWQVLAIGFNTEYQVGEAEAEILVEKPLLVMPQLPRFARVNDRIILRADVHNKTDTEQITSVTVEVANAQVGGEAEKSIALGAQQHETIEFPISLRDSKTTEPLVVTFSASSAEYSDAAELTLPVYQYASPETVATAGVSTGASHAEAVTVSDNILPGMGVISVTTSATIANYLHGGLTAMAEYPFGNNAVIADRLLSMLAYQRALLIPRYNDKLPLPSFYDEDRQVIDFAQAIRNGILELIKTQKYDGSWTYWPENEWREPNVEVTINIYRALKTASNQGFEKQKLAPVLERAEGFLVRQLPGVVANLNDSTRQLRSAKVGVQLLDVISGFKIEYEPEELMRATDAFTTEKVLTLLDQHEELLLAQHLGQMEYKEELRESIMETIENRVHTDARGMFVKADANTDQLTLTTLYLQNRMMTISEKSLLSDQIIFKMLSYLIRSRDDGMWGSTKTTRLVLGTLVEYLEKSRESEAIFTAAIITDKSILKSYSVNDETFFDRHVLKIRPSDLLSFDDNKLVLRFVKQGTDAGSLYYDIVMRYFLPLQDILAREEGITVERYFYRQDDQDYINPVTSAEQGEILRGRITVTVPEARRLVAVEAPIASGMELINFAFDTNSLALTDQSVEDEPPLAPNASVGAEKYLGGGMTEAIAVRPDIDWLSRGFDHTELRNNRVVLYARELSAGVHTYDFFVRATYEGEFAVPPAYAEAMETPEVFGRSAAIEFSVGDVENIMSDADDSSNESSASLRQIDGNIDEDTAEAQVIENTIEADSDANNPAPESAEGGEDSAAAVPIAE